MVDQRKLEWTEERFSLLAQLREMGITHRRQIADRINRQTGSHFTRNSICSKIQRTWGPDRPPRTQEQKDADLIARRNRDVLRAREKRAEKREREGRPPRTQVHTTAINITRMRLANPELKSEPFVCGEAPNVVPRDLTLMELGNGDCRYPSGEGPNIRFCGHPSLEGKSYCGPHKRLSYKPPIQRTKAPYVENGRHHGGIFGRVA